MEHSIRILNDLFQEGKVEDFKDVVILAAPICALFSLFVIYTFVRVKRFRSQLAQIFLMMVINDILNQFWFFINSVKGLDGVSCLMVSIIGTFAISNTFLYSLMFCIYILQRIQSSLQPVRIKILHLHLWCNLSSVIITTIFWQYNLLGYNK